MKKKEKGDRELVVMGQLVKLVFAQKPNYEAAETAKEILKKSYLQRE